MRFKEQLSTEQYIEKPDDKNEKKLHRREKKNAFRGAVMYFLFVLCLAVALAFFGWMTASDMLSLNKKPLTATINLPSEIFVSDGEDNSTADIDYVTKELKKAGLIEYEWLFKFYCKISNAAAKVDPGEYELQSSYDYRALVQNMRVGSSGMATVDVTIPEGYTMEQIFRKFDEEGVAKYEDLMDAAANSSFNYDFIPDAYGDPSRLEGYLFPDTYQFYVGMEAASAINKLLNTFNQKFTADMLTQAKNMNLTVKDIVTVASMIEREAKFDEDRFLVASVAYNRLNNNMVLGFDTTILYLHQDHEGEPTAAMLEEDSPYNTRTHSGLPPTPICNPGMASITAALNPESSNYFYFYADIDTGRLNFFTNADEFNAYAEGHANDGY